MKKEEEMSALEVIKFLGTNNSYFYKVILNDEEDPFPCEHDPITGKRVYIRSDVAAWKKRRAERIAKR